MAWKLSAPVVTMRVGADDGWTLNDPVLSRLTAGNVLNGPSDGFVDLSTYAVSVDWSVGASSASNFTALTPASCRIRFYDPARNLDPNGTGTYSSKVRYNTPVRVSIDGVRQFSGFLWSAAWSSGYTTVIATDYLSKLAGVSLTATTSQGAGETGSARILRLLGSSSVNVPVTVGAGTSYTRQATDLSGNVLSNISAIAETEWGLLQPVNGGDSYIYYPAWYTGRRVAAFYLSDSGIGAVAEAGSSGIDTSRIINYATVKASGLTDSISSDASSISYYGRRTYENTTNLAAQADLDAFAASITSRYATPVATTPQQLRMVFTTTNVSDNINIAQMFDSFVRFELLGRYGVVSTSYGWSGTPFVVGYSFSYTPTSEYSVNLALADFGGSALPGYIQLNGGVGGYLDYGRVLKA